MNLGPVSISRLVERLTGFVRGRAEAVVAAFAGSLVLASWLILGGYIWQQYDDLQHDLGVEVVRAQEIMTRSLERSIQSADTLLIAASAWLHGESIEKNPGAMQGLADYLKELTH